jgi:hypothetical protein
VSGRADFFLAASHELAVALRGWKRASPLLTEPITVTVTNPYTKESRRVRTWIDDQLPVAEDGAAASADLRALPWIDQKGIMTTDLVDLAAVVMQWDLDRADSEVHGRLLEGPGDARAAVCELPPLLLARLAAAAPAELARYGRGWAATRRRYDDGVGLAGDYTLKREPARLDSQWITRLHAIAELARRAVAEDRGMFLCLSF